MLAPVLITTYNRFDIFSAAITCLEANHLAADTDVYVFSDAGRDAEAHASVVKHRERIHAMKPRFRSFNIIERERNYGPSDNMTEGMDSLLQRYGRVIVLEEDDETSPFFLTFMNEGLERYADEKRVMTVCGFTHLDNPELGDAYFTPFFACWGFATWADRWQPNYRLLRSKEEALALLTPKQRIDIEYGGHFRCLHHLDNGNIVWDLSWMIAIYHNEGLCLSPTQTLVRNTGIRGGTNFHDKSLFGHFAYDRKPYNRYFSVELPAIAPNPLIEEELHPKALIDHGFRYNLFGKIVRYFYKLFQRSK